MFAHKTTQTEFFCRFLLFGCPLTLIFQINLLFTIIIFARNMNMNLAIGFQALNLTKLLFRLCLLGNLIVGFFIHVDLHFCVQYSCRMRIVVLIFDYVKGSYLLRKLNTNSESCTHFVLEFLVGLYVYACWAYVFALYIDYRLSEWHFDKSLRISWPRRRHNRPARYSLPTIIILIHQMYTMYSRV